jgi:hypothetical protein
METCGSLAVLGSLVALERRKGSEDPWLCVPDFGQVCLYRNKNCPPQECCVNSEMYLGKLAEELRNAIFHDQTATYALGH